MTESLNSRQSDGALQRRWFSDDYFDLIVWENENKDIVRFQLCYNKFKDEHAFVWNQQDGHSHLKVDDGEGVPDRYKMSPILIADGHFEREAISARFLEAGKDIDQNISQFVYSKLKEKEVNHGKG